MQLKKLSLPPYRIICYSISLFLIISLNVFGDCKNIHTSFTTSETIICGPGSRTISLTNKSTGDEASTIEFSWYLNGVSFDKTTGLKSPVNSTISEIGTYAYMLVAIDKNGCKDTAVVTAFIHPNPIANFTVSGNNCGGNMVTFKNISSGTGAFTSYSWDFGDGSKSSEVNPVHTYAAIKSFHVSLTVSNGKGCSNVYKDTITLSAGPNAIIEGKDKDGDTKYCLSTNDSISKDTVEFYNFSTHATSYRWDFGDGTPLVTTASKEKITHVYVNYGTFKVTMLAISADGCEKSTTLTIVFNRSVKTSLSLSASELSGCMPFQVMPVNTSLNADSYVWNFGDGSPAITVNNTAPFTHLYLKKGSYVISLKASNSCNDASVYSDTIKVGGNPVPKAHITPISGCSPQEVNFINEQVTPGTTYNWHLGDASEWTGSGNPPVKIYSEGKWKIVVTATNNCGSDSLIINLKVNPTPVIPDVRDKAICYGSTAKLEVLSPTGVYEWFDSSVNGTQLATGMIYITPALKETTTYYVQSKSGDCISKRQAVKVNVITLPDPPLVEGLSICKGNTVTLKIPLPGKYEWYNSETGGICLDTTAVFTSPPLIVNTDYFVQVTVGACKSIRRAIKIKVLDPPKASFATDTVCHGKQTHFEDLSTEHPNNWLWDFGDGTGGRTGPSIKHTYSAAGSYIAKLTVSNGIGCNDSVFKRIVVYGLIKPGITSKTNECIFKRVEFKDSSSTGNDSIVFSSWNFGDSTTFVHALNASHVYNKSGNYQITHQVISDKGCVSEVKTNLLIAPQPIAAFSSTNTCQIQQSIFKDQSTGNVMSWSWDFGDAAQSTLQHPEHAYAVSGYFNASLIVKTDYGCTDTASKRIFVYPQPIASFTTDTVCWGDTTSFKNTSLSIDGKIDKVIWDFDDATYSTQFDPLHSFVMEKDVFNVSLAIITSHGCMDTVKQSVYTKPIPVFEFFSKEKAGCEDFTTSFYDTSTVKGGKIINWLWNFGDGNLTYKKNPTHTFDEAGSYFVSLKLTSSYGCEIVHRLSYPIVVYPQPVAAFLVTPDEISIARPTSQFIDQSSNATLWDWDFGDHKTSIERNPFHTYADTGTFIVSQMVINSFGCADTTTAKVRVNAEPALFIPNAFSPNEDQLNDEFIPVGKGISNFNMQIFDRWGKKVFETDDLDNGWNGRMNGSGEVLPQDVYVYKISLKDVLQKVNQYTGSVLLTLQ